jgi:hypothetical protein
MLVLLRNSLLPFLLLFMTKYVLSLLYRRMYHPLTLNSTQLNSYNPISENQTKPNQTKPYQTNCRNLKQRDRVLYHLSSPQISYHITSIHFLIRVESSRVESSRVVVPCTLHTGSNLLPYHSLTHSLT